MHFCTHKNALQSAGDRRETKHSSQRRCATSMFTQTFFVLILCLQQSHKNKTYVAAGMILTAQRTPRAHIHPTARTLWWYIEMMVPNMMVQKHNTTLPTCTLYYTTQFNTHKCTCMVVSPPPSPLPNTHMSHPAAPARAYGQAHAAAP